MAGILAAFDSSGTAAELGDDGLYKQPFLSDTFLDMTEDLADATDFDGEAMVEKDLARKWFVSSTPTTLLFTWDDPDTPPANLHDALAFMMPGYFKPFHHISGLEYVEIDGFKSEPDFLALAAG